MPLSTIVQPYHDDQFQLVWEQEYLENTTDLPNVIGKIYHIILHRVDLTMGGIQIHNVSGNMHCLYSFVVH
jgi:hypothetical protein